MLRWPILERIPLGGDLRLSPHALGITLGFVLAAHLFRRRVARRGLTSDGAAVDAAGIAQDVFIRAAFGAVVAARLTYVVTHLDRFSDSPLDVLRFTDGGLSFLGGLIGALLVCLPWLARQGFDGRMVLDAGAPAVAVGLLLGRLGDLVIGDHLGAPADGFPLAWRCTANLYDRGANALGRIDAVAYPSASTPTQGCYDVALHQTALYDGVAALVVLAVVLVLDRRPRFPGAIAAAWVLTYAPLRALGDVVREDRRFAGLTGAQWVLLAAVIAVLAWLGRRRERTVV